MGNIIYCNILLKKKVTKADLINWAENHGINFDGVYSIQAIQYYLYDFKKDLSDFFANSMNLNPESIEIEEIDSENLRITFKTEACYPSFHKPKNTELTVIWESDPNVYSLNYFGFEIDFELIK